MWLYGKDNRPPRAVFSLAAGVRLEIADGRLDVLKRLRKFCRRRDAIVDAALMKPPPVTKRMAGFFTCVFGCRMSICSGTLA